MAKAERHRATCFPPIAAPKPEKLILGTSPGVKSLQEKQYYAHPQNGFWKILGELYDMPVTTYDERRALIKKNGLAVWDVLESCTRHGSLDAGIDPATVKVNDFSAFLKKHKGIREIFFNGMTAEKEFIRRVFPKLPQNIRSRLVLKRLPSTSPAHAGMKAARKTKEWSALLSSEKGH